jgi:hypothetical protein
MAYPRLLVSKARGGSKSQVPATGLHTARHPTARRTRRRPCREASGSARSLRPAGVEGQGRASRSAARAAAQGPKILEPKFMISPSIAALSPEEKI